MCLREFRKATVSVLQGSGHERVAKVASQLSIR